MKRLLVIVLIYPIIALGMPESITPDDLIASRPLISMNSSSSIEESGLLGKFSTSSSNEKISRPLKENNAPGIRRVVRFDDLCNANTHQKERHASSKVIKFYAWPYNKSNQSAPESPQRRDVGFNTSKANLDVLNAYMKEVRARLQASSCMGTDVSINASL